MLDNSYTTVSVHRKISCLRVFYRYLRKEGIMKSDPLEKVVLPKRKKTLPVFVEEESLTELLDNYNFGDGFAGIRNRTIIEMLYLTGMRRAELIGFRNSDVDLDRRYFEGYRKKKQAKDNTNSQTFYSKAGGVY